MKNIVKILKDRKLLYIKFSPSTVIIWDSFSEVKITVPQNSDFVGVFKIPPINDPFSKIGFDGEFLYLDNRKIKIEPAPNKCFLDDIGSGSESGTDIDIDINSLKWLNKAIVHPSDMREHLEYLWIFPTCLVSTDGHRLHLQIQSRKTAEKHPEFAIPRRIAFELTRIPFKKITLTAEKYKLRIGAVCDGYTAEFLSRTEADECPPYDQIIPKNKKESFGLKTKNFVKWLKKHKKIINECLLTAKRDQISAVIQNADSTVTVIEHFDLIDSTFSRWEPFIFMVNVNYLIDVLDGADTAVFSFEDRDNLNPVKVEIPGQQRTAVLMPMRF